MTQSYNIRPQANTYPFNLIRDLYNEAPNNHTRTDSLYLAGLYEAIELLEPLQQKFIRWRYIELNTKSDCGKQLGLSPNELQDFQARIFAMLKSPTRAENYTAMAKKDHIAVCTENDQLKNENEKLKDVIRYIANGQLSPDDLIIREITLNREYAETEDALNEPVESLDLPNGVYNACKRNGLNTVRDILMQGRQLNDLQWIGNRAYKEIDAAIELRGFDLNTPPPEPLTFGVTGIELYHEGLRPVVHIQLVTTESEINENTIKKETNRL